MEKRTDSQVYIVCHKPVEYGQWDNALYTPIQVGSKEQFCELRDNTGDSIADWNFLYAEGTAMYWVYRNMSLDTMKYVGFCQYRRRLEFPEDVDFDELFKSCDIITPEPLNGIVPLQQYVHCHSVQDMVDLCAVIAENMPEWIEPFKKYMANGTRLWYANSYIMKVEDFKEYAGWLFKIFDLLRIKKGWENPQVAADLIKAEQENGTRMRDEYSEEGRKALADGRSYNAQVFAFLQERLLTMYIQEKFPRVMEVPYVKYENLK